MPYLIIYRNIYVLAVTSIQQQQQQQQKPFILASYNTKFQKVSLLFCFDICQYMQLVPSYKLWTKIHSLIQYSV